MTEPTPPARRVPPELRDEVLERLTSLFTAGRIELEDMERRMEVAARAETPDELARALEGLRETRPVVAAPPAAPMGPDRPRGKRWSLAFMSGINRKGRWFPARRHTAVVLMGGVVLDFRHAELEPGTTEVDVWVMWGGVEIIVPPDLDAEVDGFAIMGGVKDVAQHPGPLEQQRSRLRVRARVLMGGVDVKVRQRKHADPDAPALPKPDRKRLR
jgi:hypothetical protein